MDFIWDARLRQTNKWGGHSKAERVGLPSGAGGPRGWAGLVSVGPAVLPTGVRAVVYQVGRAGQLGGRTAGVGPHPSLYPLFWDSIF